MAEIKTVYSGSWRFAELVDELWRRKGGAQEKLKHRMDTEKLYRNSPAALQPKIGDDVGVPSIGAPLKL